MIYLIWDNNQHKGRIAFNKEDAKKFYWRMRKQAKKNELTVYWVSKETIDTRGFARTKADVTWEFAE